MSVLSHCRFFAQLLPGRVLILWLDCTIIYFGVSYRFHSFNSMFRAELCAIYRGFLYIRRQTRQSYFFFCTVSLSTLQSVLSCRPDHQVVVEILQQISDTGKLGEVLCFAGCLAMQAVPTFRLLKQLLRRLLRKESWYRNELPTVMFLLNFCMQLYLPGRMNGAQHRTRNCGQ
jgi:hypothetical protein